MIDLAIKIVSKPLGGLFGELWIHVDARLNIHLKGDK